MTCGDAVETLEERVITQSSNVKTILNALARLRKDLPQIYKSQADIAYTQALTQNEVLLKEQASEFERKMDNFFGQFDGIGQFDETRFRRDRKNLKTADARDEYLRIKSHEWVQEQSVIFVENVIKDMQALTSQYRTQGGQLPCNVSRANKYMV